MIFKRKKIALLFACLVILISDVAAGETPGQLKAPDFTLPLLTSKGTISLSEILPLKKFTVVVFFNHECPDCLAAVASLRDLPSEFEAKGLPAQIIGVDFDPGPPGKSRSFIRGEKISFDVAADFFGEAANLYGCTSYSFSYFIVDNTGAIRDYRYNYSADMREFLMNRLLKLAAE